MELYNVLENILKEKNITIAEVARLCELPDSTVRGIISRRQKSIALDVAIKLSKGLCVSLAYLNGENETLNKSTEYENFQFYIEEKEIIKKYRLLDNRGKAAVVDVINRELHYISKNDITGEEVFETLKAIASEVAPLNQISPKVEK